MERFDREDASTPESDDRSPIGLPVTSLPVSETGLIGGSAGAIGGAVIGGVVGGAVGAAVGAVAGAAAGAMAGEAVENDDPVDPTDELDRDALRDRPDRPRPRP